MLGPLKEARLRRKELAAKVATLPTTGEGMTERKERFDAGFDRLEEKLHEATVQLQGVRAQLVAIDLLYGEQLRSTEVAPTALENTKRRIQEFKSILDDLEVQREAIKRDLDDAELTTTMSGGKGAREQTLREAYRQALDEEIQLGAGLNTDEMRRAAQADQRAMALFDRNQQFLDKLRSVVDAHVGDLRAELLAERENLRRYAESVATINTDAEGIRDAATRIALDHVRAEVHDIVVRADVGIIDVAFARKQRETEKIGRLQRQKSEELTQLNQAYADLTQDEATD
jgi:chromosome segregation ATPase